MSKPSFVRQHFEGAELLTETQGGNFGQNYRCTRPDGEERLVKVRKHSQGDWFVWGLWKEYAVTSVLGRQQDQIPAADAFFDDGECLGVSFPFVQSQADGGDREEDVTLYRAVRDDLASLRKFLDTVEHGTYPPIDALDGNDQWYEGEFGRTVDYFFEDRLANGVFFSDEAYDQYEPLLETCRQQARQLYDHSDRRLIHGDLQNTDNVILADDGVAAVVDWEVASWFDRRVDIAAIETSFVDDIALQRDDLSLEEEREALRSQFELSTNDHRAIHAYKAWQHYVGLEVLLSSEELAETMDEASLEAARERRYYLLDQLADRFDVTLGF